MAQYVPDRRTKLRDQIYKFRKLVKENKYTLLKNAQEQ